MSTVWQWGFSARDTGVNTQVPTSRRPSLGDGALPNGPDGGAWVPGSQMEEGRKKGHSWEGPWISVDFHVKKWTTSWLCVISTSIKRAAVECGMLQAQISETCPLRAYISVDETDNKPVIWGSSRGCDEKWSQLRLECDGNLLPGMKLSLKE